ncbi:hypothetical protein DIPPA_29612 [Diplonema papillatum]|nr:hypothetical protein DIPPA_29612 [Diplonema papillatum]
MLESTGYSARRVTRAGQRMALQVAYLTSGQYTTAGAALHFFQVTEKGNKAKKQKRLLVLVDKATFQSDIEVAMQRCFLVCNINQMCIYEEDLRPIMNLTQYDRVMQNTNTIDFIRIIPTLFTQNDPNNVALLLELEENQPLAPRVNCRPAVLTGDGGGITKEHHEHTLRRVRDSNQLEVARLRDALQTQKDAHLVELLDARTQIEQLRHSLSLSEAAAASAREAHERDMRETSVLFETVPAGNSQARHHSHQQQPTSAQFYQPAEMASPPGYAATHSIMPRGLHSSLGRSRIDINPSPPPPLPSDPPPIPKPPSPTTINIFTNQSRAHSPLRPPSTPPLSRHPAAHMHSKAGDLVDRLASELEASVRYLETVQRKSTAQKSGSKPPSAHFQVPGVSSPGARGRPLSAPTTPTMSAKKRHPRKNSSPSYKIPSPPNLKAGWR